MDVLRGFEGAAAKAYFAAVRAELGEAWGFGGRRHRPPPDPVNALLSFTYTLLHHHCSTALVTAGLQPRLGLYHRPRGTHHALASDFQEELRFLAEGVVWALLRRREIRQDDFRHRPDAHYPYLLRPDARRKVITSFERRLLTEVELPGDRRRPWREVICGHRVRSLKHYHKAVKPERERSKERVRRCRQEEARKRAAGKAGKPKT